MSRIPPNFFSLQINKTAQFIPPPLMRQRRQLNGRRTPVTENYYRSQFRFNKATVNYLVDTFLGPSSGETRGGVLSNKKKIKITPGFMNSVAEVVGVSQPICAI